VSDVVCAFIEFALLENFIGKFCFEAMKLKATKSHIFYICSPNPTM